MQQLSTFRLYTLRVAYLILAGGLGTYIWPSVFRHTPEFAATLGVRVSLLAAIGLLAALGLRYPVKMLPLLLYELAWKTIYLLAFAFPLWRHHELTPSTIGTIQECLPVVIFLPLIPWGYVAREYLLARGDRWRTEG